MVLENVMFVDCLELALGRHQADGDDFRQAYLFIIKIKDGYKYQ